MSDGPLPVLQPIEYEVPTAEVPDLRCPHCGGTTVRGELGSQHVSRFFPTFVGNVFVVNRGVPTTAFACQTCGVVTLVVEQSQQPRLARLAQPRIWPRRFGALLGHMVRPFARRGRP